MVLFSEPSKTSSLKAKNKSKSKSRRKKKRGAASSSESDTEADSSATEEGTPLRATAPPSGLLSGPGATIVEDEGERSLHVTFTEPEPLPSASLVRSLPLCLISLPVQHNVQYTVPTHYTVHSTIHFT